MYIALQNWLKCCESLQHVPSGCRLANRAFLFSVAFRYALQALLSPDKIVKIVSVPASLLSSFNFDIGLRVSDGLPLIYIYINHT
jgi:hypothetical protein